MVIEGFLSRMKQFKKFCWALFLFLPFASAALPVSSPPENIASNDQPINIAHGNPERKTKVRQADKEYLDDGFFWLAVGVLAFAFFSLIALVVLIRNVSLGDTSVRILGLALIIPFVAFVCVVSEFSAEKVAPVIGIFGTAIGYLLGSGREKGQFTRGSSTNEGGRPNLSGRDTSESDGGT